MGINKISLVAEIIYNRIYSKYLAFRNGLSLEKCILALPDDDPELNYYALKHINDFMERFFLNEVIVMSTVSPGKMRYVLESGRNISFRHISRRQMERLIRAHRMFGAYTRVVSLNFPPEKKTRYMVGINGITKEDVVCRADYQLFQYESVTPYEKDK